MTVSPDTDFSNTMQEMFEVDLVDTQFFPAIMTMPYDDDIIMDPAWHARMMTPVTMRPPPMLVRVSGICPVIRLCTMKAATSSMAPRLDTRLGQASCRDRVWVVKASSPETESPVYMAAMAGVTRAQAEGVTSIESGEARQ